ncbi:hypothetical protein H5410_046248 [Solanum commersonii]|uniref:Uncharacterized protein n=1 Tax=Solanum commersonii TaxID=4109 RepID=A0A9J5XF46_SOLCO|nr:hypothetical protein H5410_046248 [Solanum commersonii]
MMGPTVLDIVSLTELRPHGKEVSAMLGIAGSTINFSMCRGFFMKEVHSGSCSSGYSFTFQNSNLREDVLRPKLFKEYFLFFHKCTSRTVSQFTPFSSKKFGPVWVKKSLDPNF